MAKETVKFVQTSGVDLSTFEDVTLRKVVPPMPAIDSLEAAMAVLGNSQERLLDVVRRGLWDEHQKGVKADSSIPWRTVTEDNKINGEFQGTLGDSKKVAASILNFAKMAFGYSKDMTADQKRKAKDSGREMLKTLIAAGTLKTDYFLPSDEDEDGEAETEA